MKWKLPPTASHESLPTGMSSCYCNLLICCSSYSALIYNCYQICGKTARNLYIINMEKWQAITYLWREWVKIYKCLINILKFSFSPFFIHCFYFCAWLCVMFRKFANTYITHYRLQILLWFIFLIFFAHHVPSWSTKSVPDTFWCSF